MAQAFNKITLKPSLLCGLIFIVLSILQPGCRGTSCRLKGEPNILLITIDTLRADYIGCYGSPDVKTPNIDRLAASGVQFMRNVTPSQCTNASHASILTGLYPSVHGVTDNQTPLTDKAQTLAEIFKQKGFTTLGAVSAGHLNPINSNFGQGFDTFIQCEPRELNAAQRNETFFKKLDDIKECSFFAWVHYFDPHGDYTPPPPYDKTYPPGSEYEPVPFHKGMNLGVERKKRPIDPDEIIALYKGEITFVDSEIGKLLEFLEKKKLREKTLVVLVADHGESMTEKGVYFCHEKMYNPVMHVPLLMSMPGKLPKGLRIDSQTSSVDIFPTVLDLLHLKYNPGQIDGRSMVPMFTKPNLENHAFVISEATDLAFRTVYQDGFKLIQTNPADGSTGNKKLYRPWSDYHETTELGKTDPGVLGKMEALLKTWLDSVQRRKLSSQKRKTLDDKTRDTLKTLGYIE